MPSVALHYWHNQRLPRLGEVEAQLVASHALAAPNPHLADENVRGYIVLLSAHFQGFCRDLHTESSQTIVSRVRLSLQFVVQAQFLANRALDSGNPNLHNIRKDFERLGSRMELAATDPANPPRLHDLSELNTWRNIAAHHGPVPPSGLPSPVDLRRWTDSCTGLTVSLDGIMYHELRRILRRAPWVP